MLPDNRNKKGSGFTNLNRVLQANQGNRLGTAVSGGVQNLGQNVRTQTQQAQGSFQEQAQKNRLDTDEAKQERSNIIGRFNQPSQPSTGTQAAPQSGNTVATRPLAEPLPALEDKGVNRSGQPNAPVQSSGFTPVTDDEVQKFTRFRTGTYAGPKQLDGYDDLSGKAAEAEQVGALSRSAGGRQELLRRFVGGRDYTQGEQRLDTALLGLTGQEGLSEARRATRGLGMDVAQANQSAAGLAQEYANRAKIFGEETVGQLQGARDPLSQGIDTRLKQYQDTEAQRIKDFQDVQNFLSGQGEQYQNIDKFTRLGLGLQNLADKGMLNQAAQQKLLGDRGLISRAEALGLDTNKLIAERLKDIKAQGLTRSGAANTEEEAKVSSLDRLMGKIGTDVEFGAAGDEYKAGSIGFDPASLEDYISKSENEKAQRDATYAEKLAAERAQYLNQAGAYGMQAVGGLQNRIGSALEAPGQVGDAYLNNPLNPIGTWGDLAATDANFTANQIQGTADMAIGGAGANAQAQNALAEGLLKLNIGGKSLGQSESGKKLQEALRTYSDLQNTGLGLASGVSRGLTGSLSQFGQGASQLGRGNISTGLSNIAKSLTTSPVKSIGKSIGGAVSGLKKKLCFAPNTEVLMENGKYKKIKDIQVGEQVALGGKVITIGEGLTDSLYKYGNVEVTADHAVYENGKWIRVKESEKAYPVGEDDTIIYPIGTETHLLVTRGQIWADVFEIENHDSKDLDYNLNVLNENKPRNRKLDRFIKEYFEDDVSTLEKIKTPF